MGTSATSTCGAPGLGEGKAHTCERTRSGIRWLGEKLHVWHGGCEWSWAGALRVDPQGAQFRPRPQQSCIVHVERDIRLLVHGDDFMAEMVISEEK